MSRAVLQAAWLLPLLLVARPASAQSHAGVYTVDGTEPGRGAYTGQVELRWDGNGYAFLREIEYSAFTHQGHPVSTVWRGRAFDVPAGVGVQLFLGRMGWSSQGAGVTRTAADGLPLGVVGELTASGQDLLGTFTAPGFSARTERWAYQRATGPSPIWIDERRVEPSHSAPAPWLQALLDPIFAPFRQTPWMQPYVNRPELQAGIHAFTFDRTDYALHRQRPDLLRVIDRVVDPLTLEEAIVKANAFGKTLRQKQEASDLELPLRYVDQGFLSGRALGSGVFVPDGDSAEWTGDYALSQAWRYQTSGEPEALANVERTVEALTWLVDITGQPGEFARTLRTPTGPNPPSAIWHRGTGRFANVEWMEGGNNDMIKGLATAGIASLRVLAPGHRLRGELAQALESLTQHSPVVRDGKFNEQMINGVIAGVRGPGPAYDRYRQIGRNPFLQLYTVAHAAGYHYYGIAGWSGAQLELTTLIVRTELADIHGQTYQGLVNRLGIRRSAERQRKIRRAVHALTAAGLARLPAPWSAYDAQDAKWVLREWPHPRPTIVEQSALRADWCASPYPALPWKFDFTVDPGRAQGLIAPPFFEVNLSNFFWKDNGLRGLSRRGGGAEWHAGDYLFAYWLGRAHGVIGPND